MWSISSDKLFRRCQRQWFYKQVFGNANVRKNLERYEAYLLSKISTVSAIRGQAVDDAISEVVIPAVNQGRLPNRQGVQSFAQDRFQKVLRLAEETSVVELTQNPGKLPEHFKLLFEEQYGDGLDEGEISRATSEIDQAIENFFSLTDVLERLRAAEYVIAQRPFVWKIGGHSIRAVPDVVAFYRDAPPIVLDWKVHLFANADAARQLASYALALARAKPHKDYRQYGTRWPELETRLWEVQLLKGEVRVYDYDEEEYLDLERWIGSRVTETSLALHGRKKSSDFSPEEFPTAIDGRLCQRCNYKKLCWS